MPSKIKPLGTKPGLPKTEEEWDNFFRRVVDSGGNVTRACELGKFSRWCVYEHEKKDPAFALRLAVARQAGLDVMEEEAMRRAVEGVEEPVGFHMGVSTTVRRNYSDSLIQFLLRGGKPDKYRDRSLVEVKTPGAGPDLSGLSEEDLEAILARKSRG